MGIGQLDANVFALDPGAGKGDGTGAAFFVNGLYTRDSAVGRSTLLNVKLTDRSLLLNTNWNPYVAQAPFELGEW